MPSNSCDSVEISVQESGNAIDSQKLTKTRRAKHERANDLRSKSAAESAEVEPTCAKVLQQRCLSQPMVHKHEINPKTYYNWQKKGNSCPFYNLLHGLIYSATCGKSMDVRYEKDILTEQLLLRMIETFGSGTSR